ncbi:hypothetical protein [Pseudorhodoplanes sp.]|uniref:hypothetical protein n=1 Tax=Pseudorhodoplanes sp. TaxID=1934341 RepID=UPI002B9AA70C|nr:hypothetical protein [Pseudorhodoplanes sp.]HWV55180.1 hypothetical protein [Pseudorhodoplanes sp.]
MKRIFGAVALLASSTAAMAQEVTYKQLEGHTVTASFTYAQTVRLLEQGNRIVNNENRQTMTLKLLPDNLIDQNYKIEIVTRDGRQVGGFSGNLTAHLNKPTKWQHGEMLFTFDGNSLVRLQTFAKGGRKITVSFTRANGGFACKVEAPFAKEEGADGGTATTSQTNRQKIEILSATTVRSDCRVIRSKA